MSRAVPQTGGTELPRWFEVGLILISAGLVCTGGFGLLLADAGDYRLPTALLGGVLGTALFGGFALRGSGARRADRTAEDRPRAGPAVLMCVVAASSAAWNGLLAGHYVFVDRDPGVYAAAGRWLASHGGLVVHGGDPWLGAGARATNWASAGMYPVGGGRLEFQFNHFLPVLLAEVHGVAGDRAMFATNAVLGALALCAVFAVGCRLTGRPWLVVAGVGALALSLPQLMVSRDTYSEPTTEVLLWSSLWLLTSAWQRRHVGLGALGGLTLGGIVLTRIDALVYLLALLPVAALSLLALSERVDRRRAARLLGVVIGCAVAPVALGSWDLMARSAGYYAALRSDVIALRWALAGSAVLAALLLAVGLSVPALRKPPAGLWRAGFRRAGLRRAIAIGSAVLVGLGLSLAWAVRPALQHPTGTPNSTVAALQRAAGVAVNARLTYSEHSMSWLAWYLGPIVLALAVIGLAALTYAAVRGRPAALLVSAAAGPGAALYLWRVSNTAEQVWVMRRYVPAALPLFALAAVVGAGLLLDAIARRSRLRWFGPAAAVTAAGATAAAMLAVPVVRVLPIRGFESQRNYLPAVTATCDRLGPRAAVLFTAHDIDSFVFTQTLRSWCDIPVSTLVGVPNSAELGTLADLMHSQHRTLWVLGSTRETVQASVGARTVLALASATGTRNLEATLTRPPSHYRTASMWLWGSRIG